MPSDSPSLRCHSLNAKYQFKQYFTRGPIDLFRKIPRRSKIRPPLQKFPGTGLINHEIIINGLVSSFRFIWIPMLWIYDHYTVLIISERETTLDVRFWYLKSVRTERAKEDYML